MPNHLSLLENKEIIEKEFKESLKTAELKIEQNINRYKFLHTILTATGDELVKGVIEYFSWLEVDKIVDKDKISTVKEEDLQVFHEEKLVIIEVKGINGPSQDKDCSQISKVRYRRIQELKRREVFCLYLVNHQKGLPPLSRDNPPFKPHQIEDASYDSRGLITTWDLFKAYNLVQAGILTRSDIKSSLFDFGLIHFKPISKYKSYGQPIEVHNNGIVVILNLDNSEIKVSDSIVVERGTEYLFCKILGVMKDDTNVKEASHGEVGVRLQERIKLSDSIWILK